MVTNPENSSAEDATTPIEVYGDSPDRVDIPLWVSACIQLDPPRYDNGTPRQRIDRVYNVVLLLMSARYGARPDETIVIDRASIARWAGVSRADKAFWIVNYLERIRFVEVYRRWGKGGRKSNAFDMRTRPPADYVGPQTAAELDVALRDPNNPPMLFAPGHSNTPAAGALGSTQYPGGRGDGDETPGHSNTPAAGALGSTQYPGGRGDGDETPGHSNTPAARALPARARGIRREGNSPEGEFPEPKAGAPAAGAAAGDPLEDRPDLAELVARLPWPGDSLALAEARQVVEAMVYAEQQVGWDQDRLRSEGVNALTAWSKRGKGSPTEYVARRYREGHRLGRFELAPRSQRISGELPSGDEQHQGVGGEESEQEPAGPVDRRTGEVLPVWCGECNDGTPVARTVKALRLDHRGEPCSTCHPDAVADTSHGEAA